MRLKEEIGMKGPQRAFGGDLWYGMGSSSQSNFSATKTPRERPYRSIRFGATVKEWNVCRKMVFLRENGYTYGQIAKYLNDANILTKGGKVWNYYTARFVTLRAKEEIENGRSD